MPGDDIRERKNLAAEMPGKRDELLGVLHGWQDELAAPRPGEPDPEFDEKAERKAIEKVNALR